MRKLSILVWSVALSLVVATPVLAEEKGEEEAGEEGVGEESGALATEESAPAPGGAAAAPAPAPVASLVDDTEEILWERYRGVFFEGRGGAYLTVGGARGYSNVQPVFGFTVGYDILDWLYVDFSYATGYQASNPLKAEGCVGGDAAYKDYHCDFSLTYFLVGAGFSFIPRGPVTVEARIGAGVSLISPSAKPDQPPVDGAAYVGLRLKHFTLLKHFSIIAETGFYITFPTLIPALAPLSISVMYTF
jgi:hypothetical protein